MGRWRSRHQLMRPFARVIVSHVPRGVLDRSPHRRAPTARRTFRDAAYAAGASSAQLSTQSCAQRPQIRW